MSKHTRKAREGSDFTTLDNGVMVVARETCNLIEPYNGKIQIPDYLGRVDHSLKLKRKKYERRLAAAKKEFNRLVRGPMAEHKFFGIVALQGRDAAGKTGTRRCIDDALYNDGHIIQCYSFGAPTADEAAHPDFWRFMYGDRMPQFGDWRVFDRTWNEQLLVVPVEKLASRPAIEDSYAQIRAFEWLLQSCGGIMIKVWLDISYDEQGRRFDERAEEKPEKLSDADSKARGKFHEYTRYANEMLHRTGTCFAPWNIVSSENKKYCHVAVLELCIQAVKDKLAQHKQR